MKNANNFDFFFSFKKNVQVFFAIAVTRCLRIMLHLGRVPQAAAGSVLTHGVQVLPGHRISSPKAGATC